MKTPSATKLLFRVVQEKQSYRNMLYLMLSFPLGLLYFVLLLEAAKSVVRRVRAEQAEQRRRELVVNVSHELRAPITSISAHLESLLMKMSESAQAPPARATLHTYLHIAHNEVLHLSLLVDDLLSLARMEAGELRLTLSEIAAGGVMEEVYQALQPLAEHERHVTLVRGALPHLPPVLADRQRLVQVLLNLVRNAITSTPAGGIVSINLQPVDAWHLALVVADNGTGIPVGELEHIFERFYRTSSTHGYPSCGSGLGLAIVRDLVTAMGGSIHAESTVGLGSRFCVQLRTSQQISLPFTSPSNRCILSDLPCPAMESFLREGNSA